MSIAERQLLLHFLGVLSEHQSSAGCNDMDQSVFKGMSPDRLEDLKSRFDKWDERANPEDYEGPRKLSHIPDFLWVGYLESKLKESL